MGAAISSETLVAYHKLYGVTTRKTTTWSWREAYFKGKSNSLNHKMYQKKHEFFWKSLVRTLAHDNGCSSRGWGALDSSKLESVFLVHGRAQWWTTISAVTPRCTNQLCGAGHRKWHVDELVIGRATHIGCCFRSRCDRPRRSSSPWTPRVWTCHSSFVSGKPQVQISTRTQDTNCSFSWFCQPLQPNANIASEDRPRLLLP
jgi:hypothetical protein